MVTLPTTRFVHQICRRGNDPVWLGVGWPLRLGGGYTFGYTEGTGTRGPAQTYDK